MRPRRDFLGRLRPLLLALPLAAAFVLAPHSPAQLGPTTIVRVGHIPEPPAVCAAEFRAFPQYRAQFPDVAAGRTPCYDVVTYTAVVIPPAGAATGTDSGLASATWDWNGVQECALLGCWLWWADLKMYWNYLSGQKVWLASNSPNPDCTQYGGFATFTVTNCSSWGQNTALLTSHMSFTMILTLPLAGVPLTQSHWMQVWANDTGGTGYAAG